MERYPIKTPGPDAPAGNLSGGNIQRLVLARAFDREPTVLVLQNPTRGLDLRSAQFVYDPGHEARAHPPREAHRVRQGLLPGSSAHATTTSRPRQE